MDDERQTGARQQSWRDRTRSRDPLDEDRPLDEPAESPDTGPRDADAPPADAEVRVEASAREVQRRDGEDRRVREEPVAEDRRVEARRGRDREALERRQYVIHRVTLGVDYLFYLLYGLLAVRLVLALLGAAETAGFVQLIRGLTGPFYAPFSGIVSSPPINGGVLDFPLVIALLAYVLLHVAVRGLLRLLAGDRVAP